MIALENLGQIKDIKANKAFTARGVLTIQPSLVI